MGLCMDIKGPPTENSSKEWGIKHFWGSSNVNWCLEVQKPLDVRLLGLFQVGILTGKKRAPKSPVTC